MGTQYSSDILTQWVRFICTFVQEAKFRMLGNYELLWLEGKTCDLKIYNLRFNILCYFYIF